MMHKFPFSCSRSASNKVVTCLETNDMYIILYVYVFMCNFAKLKSYYFHMARIMHELGGGGGYCGTGGIFFLHTSLRLEIELKVPQWSILNGKLNEENIEIG